MKPVKIGGCLKDGLCISFKRLYSTTGLSSIRGMHDIYGEEVIKRTFIVERARRLAHSCGFSEIQTPIVESSNLFSRSLGLDSDVIEKEMYTFMDKSGNSISLRPEGTAGVLRAILNNPNIPNKLFYEGPMFRYERPQRGRSRQFHQFGVELLDDKSELADVLVIEMLDIFLSQLGIGDIKLEINSLGDRESRSSYRVELEKYFNRYKSDLSSISKERLERGSVLRILDSKEEEDTKIINEAPILTNHLSVTSKKRYDSVLFLLSTLEIPHVHQPRLVRGLDYYNDTCFEFVKDGYSIAAGGRYDSLMEVLGGKSMPGVGWAAGIERLSLALPDHLLPEKDRPIAIIPIIDDETDEWCNIRLKVLKIVSKLRKCGIFVYFPSKLGTPTKLLKQANKSMCKFALFIGSEEIETQTVVVKNLDTGAQQKVSMVEWIRQQIQKS